MLYPSAGLARLSRPALAVSTLSTLALAGLLCLLGWLAPNHYLPWPSFHSEWPMAAGGVLLAAWALPRRRDVALQVPWLAVLALATALIPWLQWQWGIVYFVGDAWVSSLYLVGLALAIVVGHRIVSLDGPTRAFEALAGVVLAGAVLSTWVALCQWLELDYFRWSALGLDPGSRYYANFAQPNHFALLLVLGIVSAVLFYVRGRIGPVGTGMLVTFLALGIAMSASRAAVVQLAAVAAWLLFARTRLPSEQRERLSLTAMAAATLLVTIALFAWPALRDAWSPPANGSPTPYSLLRTGGLRQDHWLTLLDAASRRPWFGYGWYQTNAAQLEVAAFHPATYETLAQSHNQVLDLVLWAGIPLGLLLSGVLALWVARAVRRVRGAEGVMALGFVGAVLVHSLVEFPLYYAYFMLPVALVVGGICATIDDRPTIRVHRGLAGFVLLAATTLMVLIGAEYFTVEEHWRAMRFEQARIGNVKVSDKPPQLRFLTGLEEFLRLGAQPPLLPVSEDETVRIGKIAKRYPHAFYLTVYAAALADHGKPEQAIAVLGPICKVHHESLCKSSKDLWLKYGALHPRVAAIAWPAAN